jgi:hypothetical protein
MGGTQGGEAEFMAALQAVAEGLAAVRERLGEARIPDAALGELFEAHAVRDAYHVRLPLIERNLDIASAVIAHIVAGSGAGRDNAVGSTAPEATGPAPSQGSTGSGES